MSRLHGLLKRINISQLHCNGVEIVSPWHPEWSEVSAMFEQALQGDGKGMLPQGEDEHSATRKRGGRN
jgi:hypothetical protein